MPNGAYAFNKMAYVVDGAAGPVLLQGGPVIGGTEDALYVFPSTKGCFAIQADGPNFEDVITITAT